MIIRDNKNFNNHLIVEKIIQLFGKLKIFIVSLPPQNLHLCQSY